MTKDDFQSYDDKYLAQKYEKYDLLEKLQYRIKELEKESKILDFENERFRKENRSLKKENRHIKSTKAYKIWKKYASLKGEKLENNKNNFKGEKLEINKNNFKGEKLEINSYSDISKENKEPKNLKDIKVAIISDQFTYDSYKYEFDPIILSPDNWHDQFVSEDPDIFFCESVWLGFNPNNDSHPWEEKVIYHKNSKKELRKVLFDILDYCRKHSIPSVFWNKEDPAFYEGNINFSNTASHFDYVFTTDDGCMERYAEDYGIDDVHTLMFAAQPKLFNPLNLDDGEIEEVVFTGTYYVRFKERMKNINLIFDMILDAGKKLKIYDRYFYVENTKNRFPEKYEEYVYPPIDYAEIPDLYKKMTFGININTVTDSETMFARRAFELALSYTNIITNYSKAVDNIFGDNVFYFDKGQIPDFNENYDDLRLENLYNVLENHNYTKRWMQILDTIGFEYKVEKEDVSIIFHISDEMDLDIALESFENIKYDDKELILVFDGDLNSIDDIKSGTNCQIHLKDDELDIKTKYWIVADSNLDEDFIHKAVLHYQYLNRNFGIKQSNHEFKLAIESEKSNILFASERLDYLSEDNSFEVYLI